MKDLAPDILRQRLVIEGYPAEKITDQQIKTYLSQLSEAVEMHALMEPITHQSERFGWAGWIHWETSGAHFYAWDDPLFFSIDIYTCKAFEPAVAVEFTRRFFNATQVESKSF